MEPELLVNIAIRLPQGDRAALADHLAPMVVAGIAAGGLTFNLSIQPYTPDEDQE